MKTRTFSQAIGASNSSVLWFTIFAILLASGGNVIGDDIAREKAKKLTRHIYDSRMRLDLVELKYTVRQELLKENDRLTGCVYTYHGWYDKVEDRMRVDSKADCPALPEVNLNSRFAYANNRYLIVTDDSLAGNEMAGYDASFQKDHGSYCVFLLATDPRLIGIFPARFPYLKNYSMNDVLDLYETSADFEVSIESEGTTDLTKLKFLKYLGADCTLTFWLSPKFDNLPIRILAETQTGSGLLRNEFRTTWKEFNDVRSEQVVLLPLKTEARRWEADLLTSHDVYELETANVGERPSDDLFEWATMDLPDKFVVESTSSDNSSRTVKQWDSQRKVFGPWDAVPLEVAKPTSTPTSPKTNSRRWLILINLVFGVVLILVFLKKRRSSKS